MEVTDALIDKLSALSKLELVGSEREAIKAELARILAFVAQVNTIDCTGVEPLVHLTPGEHPLREDTVEPPLDHAEALKNAPKHDSDYFRVPKVLAE
ncbi:MAG: Asp-tRNA(Asn)/Glu-tRNA(Gln) amidotransferase subunit GatC [Bacteroidia bacterium]|nr:Asp-tRNA(Asn)/Glu-tRNA(Gln) amidotransferase subunit GatC [Bacteroidia bacterium]